MVNVDCKNQPQKVVHKIAANGIGSYVCINHGRTLVLSSRQSFAVRQAWNHSHTVGQSLTVNTSTLGVSIWKLMKQCVSMPLGTFSHLLATTTWTKVSCRFLIG